MRWYVGPHQGHIPVECRWPYTPTTHPWHWVVGRETAAIWPAMPAASPFIDPCRKGHSTYVDGGWVKCRRCQKTLYKAPQQATARILGAMEEAG